ncbi:hypothetical protein CLOP_g16791 [Closterium sp. NIES-67]|nr:hypothetical protein CLOP_g16791 [Closterium sp. NIES-67]
MLPSSAVRELLRTRLLQPTDIAAGPACLPPLLRAHPHLAPRLVSALLSFGAQPQEGGWGARQDTRWDGGRGWGGEGMGGGMDGWSESGEQRGLGGRGGGGNEGAEAAALDEAVAAVMSLSGGRVGFNLDPDALALVKEAYSGAVDWILWAACGSDPESTLAALGQSGASGVCGAVWGASDIAYRCRTCEHDPTCAICVPCFLEGDHEGHDYAMIKTGGGCCDCGDPTAWKRQGFCRRHPGPGHALPLPENFVARAEPVLAAVAAEWQQKIVFAARMEEERSGGTGGGGGRGGGWMGSEGFGGASSSSSLSAATRLRAAKNEAAAATEKFSDMFLRLASTSEGLLHLVSSILTRKGNPVTVTSGGLDPTSPPSIPASAAVGLGSILSPAVVPALPGSSHPSSAASSSLLETLVANEVGITEEAMQAAHRLLYKLLGDPGFKYQFALAFVSNYSAFVLGGSRVSILESFSVQIFTVPVLTPRLVVEARLLDILLATLQSTLQGALGRDGRINLSHEEVRNGRVTDDIRYVLSHSASSRHVTARRPDLLRAWLRQLAAAQGMCPHVRRTTTHVAIEPDDWSFAYLLEAQLATVNPLLAEASAVPGLEAWREARQVEGGSAGEKGGGEGEGERVVGGGGFPGLGFGRRKALRWFVDEDAAQQGQQGGQQGQQQGQQQVGVEVGGGGGNGSGSGGSHKDMSTGGAGGSADLDGSSWKAEGFDPEAYMDDWGDMDTGTLAAATWEMLGISGAGPCGPLPAHLPAAAPYLPPRACEVRQVAARFGIPPALVRLLHECAWVLARWLAVEGLRSLGSAFGSGASSVEALRLLGLSRSVFSAFPAGAGIAGAAAAGDGTAVPAAAAAAAAAAGTAGGGGGATGAAASAGGGGGGLAMRGMRQLGQLGLLPGASAARALLTSPPTLPAPLPPPPPRPLY